MLNWIFLALITGAVVTAGFNGNISTPAFRDSAVLSAKGAVELAIGLIGQMSLWLGFMGILREAGLLASLARVLKPVMSRLFPDVPPEHPAMGAMIMNLAANMLGLGNAATPFGLKAMKELDTLNRHRGIATNAMALFLCINIADVAFLPLGMVAVRGTLGSKDSAGIIAPHIIAMVFRVTFAVIVCKLYERSKRFAPEKYLDSQLTGEAPAASTIDMKAAEALAAEKPKAPGYRIALALVIAGLVLWAIVRSTLIASATGGAFDVTKGLFSDWLLPLLMVTIVTVGFGRNVRVYEAFIAAAKEGFQVGVTIIPFLVAILVAVGMFRASGALAVVTDAIGTVTTPLGFPPEALPMALIRPLSATGALGVASETMKANGTDSFIGYMVSMLNSSSETTFYVLALYYGSVQVRAVRHTLAACLTTDAFALVLTTLLCHLFFK